MNFNGSQTTRPAPPVRQQGPPVPLMSVITTPPPHMVDTLAKHFSSSLLLKQKYQKNRCYDIQLNDSNHYDT